MNPYFRITQGATTPTLDVALLDVYGQLVNVTGSTVTFTLSELGGAELFERAASIVDAAAGHVRYTWLAGDTADAGRYLGRFTVVFPSTDVQEFPEDRYIRVTVTA